MIGLSANALWELWQRVAKHQKIKHEEQANRTERKRRAGAGRKKEAQLLCRLLVALLYIRHYWTIQALAESVGCAESTIWNYIHQMLPDLRAELPACLLEQWRKECSGVEQALLERWLAELPEGELVVNTWEQPIPRPKDNQKQQQYYSGKKKQHTRKNQGIISLTKSRSLKCEL